MNRIKLFIAPENIDNIAEYRRILNRDNIISGRDDDSIYIYIDNWRDIDKINEKYDWIIMYMKSSEPIKITYPPNKQENPKLDIIIDNNA